MSIGTDIEFDDPGFVIRKEDLHWNSTQKGWTALSEKELDLILTACTHAGIDNLDDCCQVVNWATMARTGHLILRGILEGRLVPVIVPGETEPRFEVFEP